VEDFVFHYKLELTLTFLTFLKTPMGTWDALTPLGAVDYTTPSEDVQLKTGDQWLLQKSARQDLWLKL
jgi:hypothetical protein